MTLIHSIFDPNKSCFKIGDPIKTFYIRIDKEIIPNDQYYISLHIDEILVSITNKFKKIIIDGVNLYELDFFANQLTLQMQICLDGDQNGLSLFCLKYSAVDELIISIESITDLYYEKGNAIDLSQVSDNNGRFFGIGYEQIIIYNDSELINLIRRERRPNNPRKFYGENTDNVIRYMYYTYKLVYSDELERIIRKFPETQLKFFK